MSMYGRNNTNIFNRGTTGGTSGSNIFSRTVSNNNTSNNNTSNNNTNPYSSNNNNNSSYNNSNNYYNNNNNNSSNSSGFGNAGSHRVSDYKPAVPPRVMEEINVKWKAVDLNPLSISVRPETLHLSVVELRNEDYFLMRKKKATAEIQKAMEEVLNKSCFNENLFNSHVVDVMKEPETFHQGAPNLDALKAYKSRALYGSGSNNNNAYSSNNNNNNSNSNSNNNSNNNSNSNSNNNNNTSSGIFGRNNNNSSNIFGANNNNNNNNSNNNNNNNNNGSSNIFGSSNNNNNRNNLFGNSNNNTNTNTNNTNNNTNQSGNNIFNRNSSSGNSMFGNNTSNNNNSNMNSSSNNIFGNKSNNSNNSNIFGNNQNNNNNNNGSNIFSSNTNNNNNRNIFENTNNNTSNNNNNIFGNSNNNNSSNNNIFGNRNNNSNNNIFSNSNTNNNNNNSNSRNLFNNTSNNNNSNQNQNSSINSLSQFALMKILQANAQMLTTIQQQKQQDNRRQNLFGNPYYRQDNLNGSGNVPFINGMSSLYSNSSQNLITPEIKTNGLTSYNPQFTSSQQAFGSYSSGAYGSYPSFANSTFSNQGIPTQLNSYDDISLTQSQVQPINPKVQKLITESFNPYKSSTATIIVTRQKAKQVPNQEEYPYSKYQHRQNNHSSFNQHPSRVNHQQTDNNVEKIFHNTKSQYIGEEIQMRQINKKQTIRNGNMNESSISQTPIQGNPNPFQDMFERNAQEQQSRQSMVRTSQESRKFNLPQGYLTKFKNFDGTYVENLEINNQYGKIYWPGKINAGNIDLSQNFTILENTVECAIPQLDRQCFVTFFGIPDGLDTINQKAASENLAEYLLKEYNANVELQMFSANPPEYRIKIKKISKFQDRNSFASDTAMNMLHEQTDQL